MEKVRLGRYRHFKGGDYEVLGVARDYEEASREVVYYRALGDSREFGVGQIWTREVSDFLGYKIFDDGRRVKRFEYIGNLVGVKIMRVSGKAVLPRYALEGDVAMDVVAVSKKESEDFVEYGTGLAFEIPSGYGLFIFPRSSVSKKDLVLANSVGILDGGYRGELMIRFKRLGKKDYEVGDRVAQIMVLPVPRVEFEEVDRLGMSDRGIGGFGSTGR